MIWNNADTPECTIFATDRIISSPYTRADTREESNNKPIYKLNLITK